MVLHVHLSEGAVLGAGGLARLHEAGGPVTAEQVRQWCANPDTSVTVQPVLDLADHLHVGSYEASTRLKLQTQLRDVICAFAFCFRPAEQCDCEHRVPHDPANPANPDRDDGGPTCSCNLAPCCRRHHRAKTTGGWTYVTVEPGVYLWRSPLGYQFLKDHTGTLDVTPDTNAPDSPASSKPTSANPDHPAPHPAQHDASGEFGALSAAWSGGADSGMVGRIRQRHGRAEPTAAWSGGADSGMVGRSRQRHGRAEPTAAWSSGGGAVVRAGSLASDDAQGSRHSR